MPRKYFTVDGIATHLRHTGPTTLPEQPPQLDRGAAVLCLHHSGGNGGNFEPLFGALEAHHRLLACDFPGHDRSGGLDSLGSVDRIAAFVGALCAKLGLPASVLLGHELGAAVALERALDAPDAVRGLVLCSGAARFAFDDATLERARLVTEGKARREFDPTVFSKATKPDILRSAFMDTLKTDPRVSYPNLLALRDWRGGERLGEIATPALVCVGADDTATRREDAEALAAALPQGRLEVVPGAGHMLPLEQPAALATAVGSFLDALP